MHIVGFWMILMLFVAPFQALAVESPEKKWESLPEDAVKIRIQSANLPKSVLLSVYCAEVNVNAASSNVVDICFDQMYRERSFDDHVYRLNQAEKLGIYKFPE
ncbi:hypothetical protein [Thalassobaculum litoreum]|uniref:hypothetical protein n=1 Tax=Thalassobaculum litoreum TaxID=420996 RepID=UPI001113D4F6|nr:hypothetical protein [Thalassobaculum litoreum]